MQGGDGLAGPRAALDHQDPGQTGADDPVLFGLDGGDDVAHPSGTAPGERGHQRGLADELTAVPLGQTVGVEHLVVQSDHTAMAYPQVPAADDPFG